MKVIRDRMLLILAVSVLILAGYGCSEEEMIKPEPEREPVWERIQGIGSGAIASMKFDSSDNLYVLKNSNRKVLFRSPDGGNTWATTDTVAIDTAYVGNISSFCFRGTTLLVGTREGKIFSSDDNGNNFTFVDSIGDPQFKDIRHMESGPGDYVYAAVYGYAVCWSSDGGVTWVDSIGVATKGVAPTDNADYTAIEIDSDGCVYLGCWAGDSYESCDYAESWQTLPKIKNYERESITVLIKGENDLLTCGFTRGFAIYRGDTAWVLKNAGLREGNSDIRCLEMTSDNVLYAGTIYDGVYRTNWGEWVWSPVNDGLDLVELKITSMAIDSDDNIYFGTVERGIWRNLW